MPKTIAKRPESPKGWAELWSWVGLLLPAVAAAAQLQALYLTSDYGCEHYQFGYNHLVSVIALVLSLIAGWISWSGYSNTPAESPDEPNSTKRKRFLNLVGIGMAALFTALIIAEWLPTLTGVPCGK